MKIFASLALALTVLFSWSMANAKPNVADLYTDAVMTGNIAELEKLLAPNYWNIASNGHIRDKEHFIADIKEKRLVVNRLTLMNTRETKVGTTRLLTSNGIFHGVSDMPRPQGLMRFTMVIAENNGEEQVVLFQATPVVSTEDCMDGNCKIR